MVVDNFINKKQLKEIKKEMLHGNFNWFYCQKSLDYDKKMQPTANMFIKQTRPEQSKTSRVESRSAKDKIAKFF